jgi:hypothetical protein
VDRYPATERQSGKVGMKAFPVLNHCDRINLVKELLVKPIRLQLNRLVLKAEIELRFNLNGKSQFNLSFRYRFVRFKVVSDVQFSEIV